MVIPLLANQYLTPMLSQHANFRKHSFCLSYMQEPRAGLRVLLIQTFGSFCQFGYEFISQLLCTVLPTELAREICQIDSKFI